MYPKAPQLWRKHNDSTVVSVSDDDPGETFWKVRNGSRVTYCVKWRVFFEAMWQITVVLESTEVRVRVPKSRILPRVGICVWV